MWPSRTRSSARAPLTLSISPHSTTWTSPGRAAVRAVPSEALVVCPGHCHRPPWHRCLRPLLARRPSRTRGPLRRSWRRAGCGGVRTRRALRVLRHGHAVRDVRRHSPRARLRPDPVCKRSPWNAGVRLPLAVVPGAVAGLPRKAQDRMGDPRIRSGISPSVQPISRGRRTHAGLVGASSGTPRVRVPSMQMRASCARWTSVRSSRR